MTSNVPTVSVVIPSYNCERFITETLESVLSQSFGDLEVIVVDDGSTDGAPELVRSVGPPVRLVRQERAGVCAARNRGIEEARGRYIALLDHDDYWFPDKLGAQIEVLESRPEVGVVFTTFLRWEADTRGVFPSPMTFDRTSYGEGADPEYSGWVYHLFLLDCWMLTSTAMFRVEVFERCGVFDLSLPYSEDWDLWLRIAREYPFVKLRQPSTLYRQHPSQGNRKVRVRDFRTELLIDAGRKWGLCSPDGSCLDGRVFRRQLAKYHTDFAFGHAIAGNRWVALRSLARALRANPLALKALAYMAAVGVGWRPRW
jgi:glycosyltransferase involved in cell wall biosynthesis